MGSAIGVLGSSKPHTSLFARTRPAILYSLLIAALLVANVWPAIYNRQPFFYGDTSSYFRGAEAGIQKLTGRTSAWTQNERSSSVSLSSVHDKTVLGGRSVYYGALLYLGDFAGRLWPVVFLQSAVVLVAISLTLQALGLFTWRRLAIISLILAVLTPMPFFVSFLMPDIFAAITILAIVNLLLAVNRMPLWTRLLWTAFLTAALLFHVSHVLLTVILSALVLLLAMLFQFPISRAGVIAVICALAVAFTGQYLFDTAVKRLVGEPPLLPPILMARMITDGPGYRYLKTTCPGSGFAVCRFLNRLPLAMDDFLWDTNPAHGVFAVADPATRRALASQQYGFAEAVVRFDPLGELTAFLRNAAIQIAHIDYEEFNYGSGAHEFFSTHLPAAYYNAMTHTRAWREGIPRKLLSVVTILTTCAAAFYMCFFLFAWRTRNARERLTIAFVLFVCAGVVTNPVVCALTSAHNRYEARVIWLVPLAAMLLMFTPRPFASQLSKI